MAALTWLRGDKETRELFEARELAQIELNSQLSHAKRKKSEEIAENLLKKGLDSSLISEVTGMSIEEIKKLKKKN